MEHTDNIQIEKEHEEELKAKAIAEMTQTLENKILNAYIPVNGKVELRPYFKDFLKKRNILVNYYSLKGYKIDEFIDEKGNVLALKINLKGNSVNHLRNFFSSKSIVAEVLYIMSKAGIDDYNKVYHLNELDLTDKEKKLLKKQQHGGIFEFNDNYTFTVSPFAVMLLNEFNKKISLSD